MDACSDPTVERVTFQKPSQVGWTEVIGNVVGYYIDLDPSPMLVIQPTVDLAKMWSKERFDPMLRDTPRMHGKIREGNRREKDQSILRKTFPGGFIAITGANSAAGLRARPVRLLIGDERDAYPVSARGSARAGHSGEAAGEGDPFSLGIKRTTTFWNRKILEGSTPTVRGQSAIERSREQSSDARYLVPCPRCGHRQMLRWRNLRWEPGQPETAHYLCGDISPDGELTAGCGEPIQEHELPAMLSAGQWVHRHPERTRWRGYWLNGLYCVPWRDLVAEWIAAQGRREELKVFVNTRLAETWDDAGEDVADSALEARRESWGDPLPAEVAVLTAAVDVQGDRLEYQITGWGAGETSWRIAYGQLWGDPAQRGVWEQLDLVLFQRFPHASGRELTVQRTAIDSGGHHTEHVYRYCATRRARGVYPIKGIGEPGRAAVSPPNPKSRHHLWTLGTDALKDIVFARLKQDLAGPGYCHFPMEATSEYFRQLTSERRITVYVKGKPRHRYVLREGRRNEALDLTCYCLAALYMLGPVRDHLGELAARLTGEAPAVTAPAPRGRRVRMRRPDG